MSAALPSGTQTTPVEPQTQATSLMGQDPPAQPPAQTPDPGAQPPTNGQTPPAEPPKKETAPEPAKPPIFSFDAVKVPDGLQLDDALKGQFSELATELNISPEGASKLLGMHSDLVKKSVETVQAQLMEQSNQWADAVRADKEIGGANLDATTRTISKALDAYGDPDVKEAFNMTRAGNHPAIVRTFYRMAKALEEGKFVKPNAPAQAPMDAAKVFFPNLPS